MAVHRIYVVEILTSPTGEMMAKFTGIDIKKWDKGVLELKAPHPYFKDKTLIPMKEAPAFTPLAAVAKFTESCKDIIEEQEANIKRLQYMRELAQQALLAQPERGN